MNHPWNDLWWSSLYILMMRFCLGRERKDEKWLTNYYYLPFGRRRRSDDQPFCNLEFVTLRSDHSCFPHPLSLSLSSCRLHFLFFRSGATIFREIIRVIIRRNKLKNHLHPFSEQTRRWSSDDQQIRGLRRRSKSFGLRDNWIIMTMMRWENRRGEMIIIGKQSGKWLQVGSDVVIRCG